jgi:CheY-like chemotaxis protein
LCSNSNTVTGRGGLARSQDDARNLFALTTALERQQIQVTCAGDGRSGLKTLRETPDIELFLLDIMMPGLDGYETARAIRRMSQLHTLPIVAPTAKAMKGDREKCLEAGASDYIPKPVDIEQLLSILRVWLPSGRTASGAMRGAGG